MTIASGRLESAENKSEEPIHTKMFICGLGLVGSHITRKAAELLQTKNTFFPAPASQIIAIDRFEPVSSMSSSHGESRITREAIAEGSEFVKLAQGSNKILKTLQEKTHQQLYFPTGGIIVGPETPSGEGYHGSTQGFVQQSLHCASEFKIPHERLPNKTLKDKFPQFNFEENALGYYEEKMGYIKPEACVEANLKLAKAYGANISSNETMLSFEKMHDGKISVKTSEGTYVTDKLVLAAGPWIGNLIPEYAHHFSVFRQTVFWFKVAESARSQYQSNNFKPFIWDRGLHKSIYGFPIMPDAPAHLQHAIKIGKDCFDAQVDPDKMNRVVSQEEIDTMYRTFIAPNFKGVTSTCVQATTCTYTTTKDFKFIIDFLPGYDEKIIVVSPCSGHGAKHAAKVGDSVAERLILGKSDINVFELFGNKLQHQKPLISSKL